MWMFSEEPARSKEVEDEVKIMLELRSTLAEEMTTMEKICSHNISIPDFKPAVEQLKDLLNKMKAGVAA